jgi:hypothetical protein
MSSANLVEPHSPHAAVLPLTEKLNSDKNEERLANMNAMHSSSVRVSRSSRRYWSAAWEDDWCVRANFSCGRPIDAGGPSVLTRRRS